MRAMMLWTRIPACAAVGLSFTACDPRELPDQAGPGVTAPDPLIGSWMMTTVEGSQGYKTTTEFVLTIDDDLSGVVVGHAHYDLPGSQYDEDYDYSLTVSTKAIAGGEYRLVFRDPTEAPERPGTTATCAIMGTTLTCDPDDRFLAVMVLERQD